MDPILILVIGFLGFVSVMLAISIKMKKNRERIKHFNIEKLKKFQKYRVRGLILFLLSISFIVYSAYNAYIFTLFVILAWVVLLSSIVVVIGSQGEIMDQKRAKLKLIFFLEQNISKSLLELAQEMEFPYSILKQNYDYLMNKGELSNHAFP